MPQLMESPQQAAHGPESPLPCMHREAQFGSATPKHMNPQSRGALAKVALASAI